MANVEAWVLSASKSLGGKERENDRERQSWVPNFSDLTVEATVGSEFLGKIPRGFPRLGCILVALEMGCLVGFLDCL